jgi:hypothetical protein
VPESLINTLLNRDHILEHIIVNVSGGVVCPREPNKHSAHKEIVFLNALQ